MKMFHLEFFHFSRYIKIFELERAENCSTQIYAFKDALKLKSENEKHYHQNSLYIKITILYFTHVLYITYRSLISN